MNDDKTTKDAPEGVTPISTDGWKRCPFCGGDPRAIVFEVHDNYWDTDWTGIVTCHECRVQFTICAKTRDELIAEMRRLWDARFEPTTRRIITGEGSTHSAWCEAGDHAMSPVGDYCNRCGRKVVETCPE